MRNFVKALFVVAVAVPAIASASITNSKHDLASGSTTTGPKAVAGAGGTDQTCKFCHAPHRALTQALIWNHTNSAPGGWAAGTTTVALTALPTAGNLDSSSQACLGCHDGTVALGDVNSGAITIAAHSDVDATGKLTAAAYKVGPTLGTAGAANHPVSIPYAGQTFNTVTSTATGYFPINTAGCTSPSGVCTTSTVAADGLAIQLFGVAGARHIECGSCHDVHNGIPANAFFLRVSPAQSAICKACHNK